MFKKNKSDKFFLVFLLLISFLLSGCNSNTDVNTESHTKSNTGINTDISNTSGIQNTNSGTIEIVSYKTRDVENNDQDITKQAEVYLPCGYDSSDKSVKYNILYFMHGTEGTESSYLGTPSSPSVFKEKIDKMIADKELDPLIIVMPTLRCGDEEDYVAKTDYFDEELIEDIIPAVEQKYNTYTDDFSDEGLKASRSHRAFGGFSMGGQVAWNVFLSDTDYFEYYMPLCHTYINMKTRDMSAEDTAGFIAQNIKDSGYTSSDYYIFAATGTNDEYGIPMVSMIDSLKKYTDLFKLSDTDFSSGNMILYLAEGDFHNMYNSCKYIYKGLPFLFKN